jgi:hypothetical protein
MVDKIRIVYAEGVLNSGVRIFIQVDGKGWGGDLYFDTPTPTAKEVVEGIDLYLQDLVSKVNGGQKNGA